MSVSGRRRSSKWDLKDEQRHSYGNARGIPRHEKEDMSLRDRELEQGWFSPEVASRNRDRWPSMEARDVTRPKHALPSKESFHGNRSSYDSDRIATDVGTRHVGDESYIMKTSRDVDEWRLEKRRRSPRNDWSSAHRSRSRSWSRSRSRSPFQNFRRQSGFDDRSRSRSGAHPPVCRDFASGRCRRGKQCQFLHQDVQNHEDNWDSRHRNNGAPKYSASHDSKDYPLKNVRSTCIDFLKGDCRRGASCRFVHDNDSDGLGRVNEATREKGNDRRIRSPERDGERESRKSSDIPCKYFSAGNCRNGRHCRFSHHGQLRPSPEKRLLDDNREQGRNSVSAENMRDGPKWSNQDSSNEKEKAWNGPMWSEKDALSDRDAITKLDETWTGPKRTGDKDENVSVSEPRLSDWSDDSGWQNGPDVNRGHGDSRVNVSMVSSSMTDSPNINVHVSEQRIAEASLDDMEMSPDWNFRIETSKNIGKIEHPQLPHSSKLHETSVLTHGQNTTKDTSGQTRDLPLILEPKSSERSYFQQDSLLSDGSAVTIPYSDTNVTGRSDLNFSGNSVPTQSALTYSSSHSVGQSRLGVPSITPGGTMDISQSSSLFPEINLSNASTIGNTNMSQVSSGIPSQSMVSDEQLTQLSNLTASLAQILGNTQQLPQLTAALNPHNTIQGPPFSNSGAMPGGTTQPDLGLAVKLNHDIASQQQYDPLSDSIESTKKNLSTTSLGLATLPVEQKFTDEQHNRPRSEKGQIFESHQSDQRNAAANSVQTNENSAAGAGEIKKDPEDKNSGPAEYVDGDEKAEESKKNKDSKGIRPFKFALAEFVKDLLKPTWKEGQISKEAYKNIVKKVVDKVTATVQGASIPQTQEKIDQYLSSSKPKLNKLVQAYVEKSQKAK